MATATAEMNCEAQPRTPGTRTMPAACAGGKVPAVVYGAGKEAVSVAVDPRQVKSHSALGDRSQHDF